MSTRQYAKQVPPAPTELAKRRRRQPTAMEIIRWMEAELVVTEGDLAGQPFTVHPFQRRFIRGLLKHTEAMLTMARGNGKTTLCAAIAAAALDGPLMVPRGQVIIVAGKFEQGHILFEHLIWLLGDRLNDHMTWRIVNNHRSAMIQNRKTGAQARVLGNNPASAHGLAPHLVLLDEPAKWPASTATKMYSALGTALGKQPGGRLIGLGTRPEPGTGNWFAEVMEAGGPGVYVQSHWAPDDDDARWPVFGMASIRAANPMYDHNATLRTELLRERDKARRRGGDNLAEWNSLRLNRGTPEVAGRGRIVELHDYLRCETQRPPAAEGPVFVGLDMGGATSMTCAAMYWAQTGLLRVHGGFAANPPLDERGSRDGVGDRYVRMHRRGEIKVYPGRVTPRASFLLEVAGLLRGHPVYKVVADKARSVETLQAFEEAGIHVVECEDEVWRESAAARGWPLFWRTAKLGPESATDIRGFQFEVMEQHLAVAVSLMLTSAIAESVIVYVSGQPKLEQSRTTSRIDALQAAILAVGAGRLWRKPPPAEQAFDLGSVIGLTS